MTICDYFWKLKQNDNNGLTMVYSDENKVRLSYKSLMEEIEQIASSWSNLELPKQSKILLYIEDELEYLKRFWACLVLGHVPVIVHSSIENFKRIAQIVKKHGDFIAITDSEAFCNEFQTIDKLKIYNIKDIEKECGRPVDKEAVKEDMMCMIQFSSGSIYEPKAIALTHKNLMSNLNELVRIQKISPEDSMCSWLPISHNLGLVVFHLLPVMFQCNHFLITPSAFQKSPVLWYRIMSEEKITITGSNNTVLKQMAQFWKEKDLSKIDLSNIRSHYIGSESVRYEDCLAYYNCMKQCGLKLDALAPGYGLTEATLVVCVKAWDKPFTTVTAKQSSLEVGHRIEECSQEENGAVTVTSMGSIYQCNDVRVVDNQNQILGQDYVGRFLYKGDCIITKYYSCPKEAENAFTDEGYLISGDIGFIHNDEIYVLGREKDMFIIQGQNFYYGDLEEEIARNVPINYDDFAISSVTEEDGSESVICFFLESKADTYGQSESIARIQSTVWNQFGTKIKFFVPVSEILKTSLGKKRRNKLKENFQQGKYKDSQFVDSTDTQEGSKVSTKDMSLEFITQKLIQIFHDNLETEVLETDNIFSICVNSIRFAQMNKVIVSYFDIDIPLAGMFQYATIADLAEGIYSLQEETEQNIDGLVERVMLLGSDALSDYE